MIGLSSTVICTMPTALICKKIAQGDSRSSAVALQDSLLPVISTENFAIYIQSNSRKHIRSQRLGHICRYRISIAAALVRVALSCGLRFAPLPSITPTPHAHCMGDMGAWRTRKYPAHRHRTGCWCPPPPKRLRQTAAHSGTESPQTAGA